MVKKIDLSMEASPLLDNDNAVAEPVHSTIHPERFTKARFTELRENHVVEKGGSARIIIFAFVVILLGVGAVLLIKNMATPSSTTTPTSSPVSRPVNTGYEISTIKASDNLATNLATNESYLDTIQLTAGDSSADLTKTTLSKIIYARFQTFARVKFDMTSSDTKLPKYTLNYDALKKQLIIDFDNLANFNSDLQVDYVVADLVKDIRFDVVNSRHIFNIAEDFRYRVFTESGDLFLDIKTVREIQSPTSTVVPTTTPVATATPTPTPTPTQSDSSKPAAPFYNNDFSQSKQYISSSVSGNTIQNSSFYVEDVGPYFEFAFVDRGNAGASYIPNAMAYMETRSGVSYLILEITNLSRTFMDNSQSAYYKEISATKLENEIGLSMANANFVTVKLKSYANGKATYEFELKRATDYKIMSDTRPISGISSQGIIVQIKD